MRFSINIPNFGDFADARTVQRVAKAAEEAGWDGLFVWDHVVHDKRRRQGQPFGDPWMLLTAAALATSRIRLGPLLTPVARRRPEQLARQVATLDALSGGRVIFGAGLGAPIADEFGSFGDEADARVLAERLDEGLGLLDRYWSGERVDHQGAHFQVRDVTLLPATVQQPRPPVWIGGYWPNRAPMRRAARWDGAVPLFASARHGEIPALDEVRSMIDYLSRHRQDSVAPYDRGTRTPYDRETVAPYDIVIGGASEPARAADVVGPLAELGVTWWDEREVQDGDTFYRVEPVLRRIEQGPPAL